MRSTSIIVCVAGVLTFALGMCSFAPSVLDAVVDGAVANDGPVRGDWATGDAHEPDLYIADERRGRAAVRGIAAGRSEQPPT